MATALNRKRRASSSSGPVDPKLQELARQIAAARVQAATTKASTSATAIAVVSAPPEAAVRAPAPKPIALASRASTSAMNDAAEEKRQRKKQKKMDKKLVKKKRTAVEQLRVDADANADGDAEIDELQSDVPTPQPSPEKKSKKDRKHKKDKHDALQKGKGKEIIEPPIASTLTVIPPPPPPEPRDKGKSSSKKRPRTSETITCEVLVPTHTPRQKKRKLTDGSVSVLPKGIPSVSASTSELASLASQTTERLRASASFAKEAGVFGEGIVKLFEELVQKVVAADRRRLNTASALGTTADHEQDDDDDDDDAMDQDRNGAPNGANVKAPTASTSKANVAPTPEAAPAGGEPLTEAELKAQAEKLARKQLRKERRDRKRLAKEQTKKARKVADPFVEASSPVAAGVEPVVSPSPSPSPQKNRNKNSDRPMRKRLGKIEKEAMRSLNNSTQSSRQSSVAPVASPVKANQRTEQVVLKVSDSQKQRDGDAIMRDAMNPRFRAQTIAGPSTIDGSKVEEDEEEIDQLASTQGTPAPFFPVRQAPPSVMSAVSSEDDPDEIALSLQTHASPVRKQQKALEPELESESGESEAESEQEPEQEPEQEQEQEQEDQVESELEQPAPAQEPEPGSEPQSQMQPAQEQDPEADDDQEEEGEEAKQPEPEQEQDGDDDPDALPPSEQPTVIDPRMVPLPPSPSPPRIATIGNDDDDSDSDLTSSDDDSDSSSSSTASNRAFRKPFRPSIGAVAANAFGSPAAMRKNRVRQRYTSPLKTTQAAAQVSTGPAEDVEEDIDMLLSQPVNKNALLHFLHDEDEDERPRRASSSSSESEATPAPALADGRKEEEASQPEPETQDDDVPQLGQGTSQPQVKVHDDQVGATAPPPTNGDEGRLSEIAEQASSAPGSPLRMDSQGSNLIRPSGGNEEEEDSQHVPLVKDKPLFLDATQATPAKQRRPVVTAEEDGSSADEGHDAYTAKISKESVLHPPKPDDLVFHSSKPVTAISLKVPSQGITPARVTRASSARARTASPAPAPPSPFLQAARPSASQPLPPPPRVSGRASTMRSLSQLDETTPRRSMRHAPPSSGPSASQDTTKKVANGLQSWVRTMDEEDESESSDDEARGTRKSLGMNGGRKTKMLWT